MNKIFCSMCLIVLVFSVAATALGQRPRTTTPQDASEESSNLPGPPPAPASVKAKYEGGVFGHNKTMEGTVNFDDVNDRFVFLDKTGREILFFPYKSLTGAFADTKKVQPAAATVAQNVPSIYALPARFIKTKVQYLTLQYNDPDSKVAGVASFKIDKEMIDSVLFTLAKKSGLTRRGEVFVRKKDANDQ